MKRKLVVSLALSLLVSLIFSFGVLAYDEATDSYGSDDVAEILNYQIVVEGFDWGPGVTKLILALDSSVEAVDYQEFELIFLREPGFIPVGGVPTDPVTQEANIVAAFLSNAQGVPVTGASTYITLELEVHPNHGVNPFTFTLSPMGNDWANPFDPVISWQGVEFTPTRTGKIMPLTDLFDLSGSFTMGGVTLQYASFVPPEAATSARPLIIWLHGGGEGSRGLTAGTDVIILGNRVTQLVAPEIQGLMGGAHVFLPQSPTMWLMGTDGRGDPPGVGYVSNYEVALLALIDEYIASTPGIDLSRIYIGGCSNGGYMAMRMLFERPNLYAAAWPVCLLYSEDWITDDKIESIVHVPIWFIHDINDPTTPHEDSLRLLNLLRAAGSDNVHLTTTDGLFSAEFFDEYGEPHRFNDHWSWIPALNNDVHEVIDGSQVSLFGWMAAQQINVQVQEIMPLPIPITETVEAVEMPAVDTLPTPVTPPTAEIGIVPTADGGYFCYISGNWYLGIATPWASP